eukprot:TRINITY_DN6352_c0_g1_i1.p1 TRINITY_DN6352_c0_g1~~TRINITY_DN6352_c0_g1_i1.p1  ORF type:complete len:449 (-),score=93.09 TRINITY_DN6352_c0_g1_i1:55-1401(-)
MKDDKKGNEQDKKKKKEKKERGSTSNPCDNPKKAKKTVTDHTGGKKATNSGANNQKDATSFVPKAAATYDYSDYGTESYPDKQKKATNSGANNQKDATSFVPEDSKVTEAGLPRSITKPLKGSTVRTAVGSTANAGTKRGFSGRMRMYDAGYDDEAGNSVVVAPSYEAKSHYADAVGGSSSYEGLASMNPVTAPRAPHAVSARSAPTDYYHEIRPVVNSYEGAAEEKPKAAATHGYSDYGTESYPDKQKKDKKKDKKKEGQEEQQEGQKKRGSTSNPSDHPTKAKKTIADYTGGKKVTCKGFRCPGKQRLKPGPADVTCRAKRCTKKECCLSKNWNAPEPFKPGKHGNSRESVKLSSTSIGDYADAYDVDYMGDVKVHKLTKLQKVLKKVFKGFHGNHRHTSPLKLPLIGNGLPEEGSRDKKAKSFTVHVSSPSEYLEQDFTFFPSLL